MKVTLSPSTAGRYLSNNTIRLDSFVSRAAAEASRSAIELGLSPFLAPAFFTAKLRDGADHSSPSSTPFVAQASSPPPSPRPNAASMLFACIVSARAMSSM